MIHWQLVGNKVNDHSQLKHVCIPVHSNVHARRYQEQTGLHPTRHNYSSWRLVTSWRHQWHRQNSSRGLHLMPPRWGWILLRVGGGLDITESERFPQKWWAVWSPWLPTGHVIMGRREGAGVERSELRFEEIGALRCPGHYIGGAFPRPCEHRICGVPRKIPSLGWSGPPCACCGSLLPGATSAQHKSRDREQAGCGLQRNLLAEIRGLPFTFCPTGFVKPRLFCIVLTMFCWR